MILVVPKKTLTGLDKKALFKKGYVVIECERPESVRVLSPEIMVDKSDLFLSALSAIVKTNPYNESEKFVYELHKRLVKVPEVKKQKKETTKVENKKVGSDIKTVLKEPIPKF